MVQNDTIHDEFYGYNIIDSYCTLNILFPTDNEYYFFYKDGLPIKLDVNTFAIMSSLCSHGVTNYYRIPLHQKTKWKIIGGRDEAVFKVKHSSFVQFLPYDEGDCVLLKPNNNPFVNNRKTIKVIVNVSWKIKDQILQKDYLITISMFREGRVFQDYRYRSVIKMDKTDYVVNSVIDANIKKFEFVDFDYKFNDKKLVMKMEVRNNNSVCKKCNLKLYIELFDLKNILYVEKYLLTSEIFKITYNSYIEFIKKVNLVDESKSVVLNIKPRIDFTIEYSIGDNIGGKKGDSLIYCTPSEKELNKTPVSFKLFLRSNSNAEQIESSSDRIGIDNLNNKSTKYQHSFQIDDIKSWVLRRPLVMGG